MGNALGSRRKKHAKIMKIDGQSFKVKTPILAGAVTLNYPNHVLFESQSVKHFGVRSTPLQPHQGLNPGKVYFLVTLPKIQEEAASKIPRRVRSGINLSAKERLEGLALARRSVSDVAPTGERRRVTVSLPKTQVERLMRESKNGAEASQKIVGLCLRSEEFVGDDEAPEEEILESVGRRKQRKKVGFQAIKEAEIEVAVDS